MNDFPCGESFTRGGIDRVGRSFAEDDRYTQDVQIYRAFRMECIKTSLDILERACLPRRAYVSIRLKRLDSIRRKLVRKNQNFNLSGLDDIIGIRLICASVDEVKAVSDNITKLPESYRVKDYTAKEHYVQTGYRAVHHIMQFPQALSPQQKTNVRFEIQVRSYYQHLWAVWSESFGENIKSMSDSHQTEEGQKIIADLQSISERIAKWELNHSSQKQDGGKLPLYEDTQTLVAVWQQEAGDITHRVFYDAESAVAQLNLWENRFPHQRENALLLVGMAKQDEIINVLAATHPLYVLGRVYEPEHWLPEDA